MKKSMNSPAQSAMKLGKYFQSRYERYRRLAESKLPDKCDTCGLRVEYVDTNYDSVTAKVSELQQLGLARYPPRKVTLSTIADEPTCFCAIGHVRYWVKKELKCPDWQMKLPGAVMTLSDYLSIHHTRISTRQATRLQIIAIVLTVVIATVGI